MKQAKLFYKQNTKLNHWYFYFGDYFNGKQETRAFSNKKEAKEYAINNGISYNEQEMESLFV